MLRRNDIKSQVGCARWLFVLLSGSALLMVACGSPEGTTQQSYATVSGEGTGDAAMAPQLAAPASTASSAAGVGAMQAGEGAGDVGGAAADGLAASEPGGGTGTQNSSAAGTAPVAGAMADTMTGTLPENEAKGGMAAFGAGMDEMIPAAGEVECPANGLSPGDHQRAVEVEGRERTYVLHVPDSYAGDSAVPAVFDFHGYGSSGSGQMRTSGFMELSDREGFVGVYPDGVGGSWHVNGCCGEAAQAQLDEIAVVRAIYAEVTAELCIDPGRVFASGISQGGGMAHHVGCQAADIFAAVAPVSSDLRTDPCQPSRPISQISFRGTGDTLSRYEGGPVGPPGGQYQSIGAEQTLAKWATINGCSGEAEPSDALCSTHKQCTGDVYVSLCTLPGAGHVLYSNPSDFNVAQAAWDVFVRHPL